MQKFRHSEELCNENGYGRFWSSDLEHPRSSDPTNFPYLWL